jgi:hypothetical protein
MAKIKNPPKKHHHYRPKGVGPKAFEKVHWPYIPVILLILLLLVFSIPSGRLQAAVKNPTGDVLAYATSMSVEGLLSSTNSQRSANGVASFSLNSKLIAAAQAKANDMASRNYWSHNTPEGNPPWIFVSAQGYSYIKAGENLATGFADEQSTVNGWMNSPSHRANMLDPVFSEVGFGYANNPNYTAAGGGPMTIMVAFYGQPVATAAAPVAPRASPPPARAASPTTPSTQPAPASNPAPEAPAPQPQAPPPPPVVAQAPSQPVTTESTVPSGAILSLRASNASAAFVKLPVSSMATGLATFIMFAAAGWFLSRHLLALRRVFVRGENYFIHHPLLDVCLLTLAALAYLLTKTAGYVL